MPRLPPVLLLAALLSAPSTAVAQSLDPAQKQFADAFVEALKSQDGAKLAALEHPAVVACRTDATAAYFDFGVLDDLGTGAKLAPGYKSASVKPLDGPAPLGALPPEGFAYPVEPTHQIEIDAETADHHPAILMRYIAAVNGRWYMVDPCPNEKGMAFFEEEREAGDKQRAEGMQLAQQMDGKLRAEIQALLAENRWTEAIDTYRNATGADLGTAATVIDAMAEKK